MKNKIENSGKNAKKIMIINKCVKCITLKNIKLIYIFSKCGYKHR